MHIQIHISGSMHMKLSARLWTFLGSFSRFLEQLFLRTSVSQRYLNNLSQIIQIFLYPLIYRYFRSWFCLSTVFYLTNFCGELNVIKTPFFKKKNPSKQANKLNKNKSKYFYQPQLPYEEQYIVLSIREINVLFQCIAA